MKLLWLLQKDLFLKVKLSNLLLKYRNQRCITVDQYRFAFVVYFFFVNVLNLKLACWNLCIYVPQ